MKEKKQRCSPKKKDSKRGTSGAKLDPEETKALSAGKWWPVLRHSAWS